ncbi:hypothetical protein Tco_0593782 [Tanacetum coccineum]
MTTYLAPRFHHHLTTYLAPRSRSHLPHWTLFLSRCTMSTCHEILLAEEQPLPVTAASPTADSPGYVPESDLEEEPEEDDEDPEEDPADYPANGDDDDDKDEDENEEEEHPAPADFVPPVHRMTARISIRDEPSISLPPREEVERLLALTTPPPSPLTPTLSFVTTVPLPPFRLYPHHTQ